MSKIRNAGAYLLLAIITAAGPTGLARNPAGDPDLPHLRKQGTATQLIVDGRPYLVLGGELGNSTASDLSYLGPFWERFKTLRLNTVLAPVYWDLIEPVEGHFDFRLVDGLIAEARRHDLRLVLLWFGSWKNSMSCYAPSWVKTDQPRFPRTEAVRGQGQEILSPFHAANWEADSRAFAALMRHLRLVDGQEHTVIMVQPENEIGMIPEARDHSAIADSRFVEDVPEALMEYLVRNREDLDPEFRDRWDQAGGWTDGTWEEIFGKGPHTDEVFMAWHFARYTEHVAAAGKREYPLPMFVNAALIRPGFLPGRYVSAGPLPHLLEVWRTGAPSIDFIAPDIYFPNFAEWTGRYVRAGNPLFVPEARLSPQSPVDALYAIGRHDAIGYSPFAIEQADLSHPVAQGFELLRELAPIILEHQGMGSMTAVMPETAFDGTVDETARQIQLRDLDYTVTVRFANPPGPPTAAANPGAEPQSPTGAASPAGNSVPGAAVPRGGILIALGADELLAAGTGMILTFIPRGPGPPTAGIVSTREVKLIHGDWQGGRWLNGDQTHQGRHVSLGPGRFTTLRIRLYRYQ